MTYSEFRMQKQADEGEDQKGINYYAQFKADSDAGNEAAKKVLNTPVSSEYGWGLLGAGLGAGGGYLVSRWLRRNGTKRQRALDMILGALLGGGGTMLALSNITGKEGLTLREQQRVDEWKREHGIEGDSDGYVPGETDDERIARYSRNASRIGGGALGWHFGAKIGDKVLPFENVLAGKRLKALAAGYGVDPAEFGKWRATEGVWKVDPTTKAVTPGGVTALHNDPSANWLYNAGHGINKFIGGAGGAVAGQYIGGKAYDWMVGAPKRGVS